MPTKRLFESDDPSIMLSLKPLAAAEIFSFFTYFVPVSVVGLLEKSVAVPRTVHDSMSPRSAPISKLQSNV